MEKTILIVSDLHLGAGDTIEGKKNPLEDFHFDEKFANLLEWKSSQNEQPFEMLILGDAFDFPQVIPEIGLQCPDPRLGTTEEESLGRLEHIIQGHRTFFITLKQFLSAGNKVRFIRGNHDIDLIWPEVQARLRREIGGGSNLIFEDSHIYRYMGLYCEHGNQYSAENYFRDPYSPVVTDPQGDDRLERCWGTYFIDIVYNNIEARFPVISNVEDGQMIRGALMAIKSERLCFTGKVVAQMLKIAYKAGLPVTGWVGSWLMGDETADLFPKDALSAVRIETAEDFLKYLRDPEISEILLRRWKDDRGFRTQFEAEIAEVVQEQVGEELHLLPPEDINRTMGLLTRKSVYQRSAERILLEEPGIEIVVFGHTHTPVNGNYPRAPLAADVTGKYFNSGSWTSSVDLDDPHNQGMNFDELCESGVRKDTLDYVEITSAPDGSVQAALGSA